MTVEFTFDFVVNHLKSKKNITFARYGDGEFYCMLGRDSRNCDGHKYFRDMGEALRKILLSKPKYYLGLQWCCDKYFKHLNRYKNLHDINTWVKNEVFLDASKEGRFHEFVKALNGHYVIQVGHGALKNLNISHCFIEIPRINCWLEKERILTDILKYVKKDCIILYSAGMPTKWFIDKLYQKYRDTITQIDCGSVFDYYVGINSRPYMRRLSHSKKLIT